MQSIIFVHKWNHTTKRARQLCSFSNIYFILPVFFDFYFSNIIFKSLYKCDSSIALIFIT